MNRGRRLPVLAAAAATLLGLLTLLLSYALARLASGDDPAAATRLGRSLLGGSLVALPLLALAGAALGRRLGRDLEALRRVLQSDDRVAAPFAAPSIVELRQLALAIERIRGELEARIAAVEAQRSTLAVLVDTVSEGLLRVDGGGRIVFANPACRELLELLPSALGQSYTAVLRHTELRALVRRALDGDVLEGAEVAVGDRRLLVSAQPVRVAGEAGVVLALADLTVLRRLEGVRRDFVANVSHELKTPLTSIRGYAETLLGDEPPPGMQRQFLQVIEKNAQRLQQIVDDLLDLSRIESGAWQPELQRVDAAELVHDVWHSCRELAERRGVQFEGPPGPVPVLADASALRQVLTNLFDNAIRYTPAGGLVQVRAQARTRVAGNEGASEVIEFEVRDTGTGIPGDALPRIFERFYRVDPARSRAAGGTGLGLAIVKHLVESMGGEVSARSELGKGTTLLFTLPAA